MDIISGLSRVSVFGAGAWDITTFLKNATKTAQGWGGSFLILLGIIGVVWAAVQIVLGLISHGKKQVSYPTQIILLLVSGALATSGLSLVMDIAAGGKATIEDIGAGTGSTIIMFQDFDL